MCSLYVCAETRIARAHHVPTDYNYGGVYQVQTARELLADVSDSKGILHLIHRDKNLNQDQKRRQAQMLRDVLSFCSNMVDCRRSQVLQFFGEKFDPANCHAGCDVCRDRHKYKMSNKEVGDAARNATRMVGKFAREDKITLKLAVDCFRGLKAPHDKNFSRNPLYGVGKADWNGADATRLLQKLVADQILTERVENNRAGYSNSYIEVSI